MLAGSDVPRLAPQLSGELGVLAPRGGV